MYVILTALFIILIILSYNPKVKRLKYLNEIRNEYVRGKIADKYIDVGNHNYHIIKYLNYDGRAITWLLDYDNSPFFEQALIGDSLIKQKDSIKITIIRGDYKKDFILDFHTE